MDSGQKSIILIGMPGVGKSTVGVILAKQLGMDFIDADLEIQREKNALLSEIIEAEGVDGFLTIENAVCSAIEPRSDRGAVIATGGSAVYGKEAMEHFARIGRIVHLSLPLPELKTRLGDLKGRGVVLREGQTLDGLYAERMPLYEKYADITVSEAGLTLEQTLGRVLELFGHGAA